MAATEAFLLSDGYDQGPVHLQCLDRRTAGRGTAEQMCALPEEVVLPQVVPRMEEGGVLTTCRVYGSLPCGLAQ
jgi:hypothetical protein